jgi:hypothetical protein
MSFLDGLKKRKLVKDWTTIRYKGTIPSYNKIFESGHWRVRHSLTKKFHDVFRAVFAKELGPRKKKAAAFSIYIFFNTRHDTDNIVGIEKFFTDTLVECGYVPGDSKEYFRGLVIVPDESMERGTLDFMIVKHK